MKRGGWRWICTLLVLVAALHALVPSGQPLQRVSGSAFSSATAEVAVSCPSRNEERRQALPQEPRGAPLPCPVELHPLAIAAPVRPFAPKPAPRGPPLWETTLSPLHPRAPPFA